MLIMFDENGYSSQILNSSLKVYPGFEFFEGEHNGSDFFKKNGGNLVVLSKEQYENEIKLLDHKEKTRIKIKSILSDIEKNKLKIHISVLNVQVEMAADLDTLRNNILPRGEKNSSFSFGDDENNTTIVFSNISGDVANELLSAIELFKSERVFIVAKYHSLINEAKTIDEIDQILKDFCDADQNGSGGWSILNGELVFNCKSKADDLKVLKFINGVGVDITDEFLKQFKK